MALTQIIAVPFWTATFWYGYGFCSHYKGSRVTGKSCISYISIRLTTKHQFMSSWVIRAIYRTDMFWMVLKICSMLKPLCGFWQRQACIVALKACIAHLEHALLTIWSNILWDGVIYFILFFHIATDYYDKMCSFPTGPSCTGKSKLVSASTV